MPFTDQIADFFDRVRQFRLHGDRAVLITCIGIALIFWVLVKLTQQYTSKKPVRFTYEAPEGLALAKLPPDDVEATLKGTGWHLVFEYLSSKHIPVRFNIDSPGAFRLNRAQLRGEILAALTSNELDITEINYDEINLRAEEKIEKRVPVRRLFQLHFDPAYHLAAPVRFEPDSVSLVGPISLVSRYSSWPTDSLEIKDLTTTLSTPIKLQAPPPEIQLNPQSVQVEVPVEAYTEKSVFVPVQINNPPADSIKVFPDKIKVTFVVGLSRYDSVQYTDFLIEADLKEASVNQGKNTVPVSLSRTPGFVKNVLLSRNSVEFFILQ